MSTFFINVLWRDMRSDGKPARAPPDHRMYDVQASMSRTAHPINVANGLEQI
jgi:hypothetical protein